MKAITNSHSLDRLLNEINRHPNWPTYRMTVCIVIHQNAEEQWRCAPNEATKKLMIDKMRFFGQMAEGFKYLSTLNKMESDRL